MLYDDGWHPAPTLLSSPWQTFENPSCDSGGLDPTFGLTPPGGNQPHLERSSFVLFALRQNICTPSNSIAAGSHQTHLEPRAL